MRPKPLVEIGGRPIIWHIMNIYAHYGVTDFIVCAGYKGYMLKEYFANLALHGSDVTFDLGDRHGGDTTSRAPMPWRVTVVDTGIETMTGGRLRRVREYLDRRRAVLPDLRRRRGRRRHRRDARVPPRAEGARRRVTAVRPPARFGARRARRRRGHRDAREAPDGDEPGSTAGSSSSTRRRSTCVAGDATDLGERVAAAGSRPTAGWPPTATTASGSRWTRVCERELLDSLWSSGDAPWKVW